MKPEFSKKLAWLAPLLAIFAAAALLRADDPPAPPADQPAPPPAIAPSAQAEPVAAPVAAPAPTAPAQPTPSAVDAAEAAREQAEKALAEAEAAAEKARAAAEKARDDARAAVEKAREEARLAAEKAREEAQAAAAAANQEVRAAVEEVQKQVSEIKRAKRTRTSNQGDNVVVGDDNVIAEGTVVPHDAVAVMGNLTVNGEVKNNAVAVLGDNTINGHVHGDVVAVVGNLILGPKAVVDGNLVCVLGAIERDPGAVVRGHTEVQSIGPNVRPASVMSWWDHALKLGRPIAIGAHLGWLWIITGFAIGFYALLGLLFPKKIAATGDKLVEEPFFVVLAAVLAVLALPVLFVLLCITIIGIPVALLVLPVGTLLVAMFGKAAIYALIGRKLTADRFHPALAVLLGALVFTLLYLVPWLGGVLLLLVWFLGFGCAVLAMFGRSKDAAPAAPVVPPIAPVAPVAASAAASAGFTATAVEPPPAQSAGFGAATPVAEPPPFAAAPVTPAPLPAATPAARPILSALTLPRAGFWIRVAAALLDCVMIIVPLGIMGAMHEGPGPMFLAIAVYNAVMWKLKGTTIGGVICGLKVVRLDDRELDWGIVIVRALTGFLSLFIFGLGFIWVAFDDEKQSWHDKIAGTTIVKVPKGTSLI
jgi:uncharacterized RDD family membrane protein YckC/cytoskeletal protein CcmA (bactofilin family)